MTTSPTLTRTLKLPSLVLFGLAYLTPLIVLGIFGIIAETTGGASPAAYLVAMVAMLFTAHSCGRMAIAYPVAGSAYTYVRRSIDPRVGFLVGWAILLDYLFSPRSTGSPQRQRSTAPRWSSSRSTPPTRRRRWTRHSRRRPSRWTALFARNSPVPRPATAHQNQQWYKRNQSLEERFLPRIRPSCHPGRAVSRAVRLALCSAQRAFLNR